MAGGSNEKARTNGAGLVFLMAWPESRNQLSLRV